MTKRTKAKDTGQKRKKTMPRAPRVYSATEKCKAVLAVWTERRTVSEICREMEITWTHLSNWQDKALEGMVQALEVRRKGSEEKPPALTKRLQKLLAKKDKKLSARKLGSNLEKRLADIQAPPSEDS